MNPTEALREEHEVIKSFLKILETMTSRLASGREVSVEDLEWTGEFCRDFVDRLHMGREEYILFPAMRDAGVPESPLSELFGEHELARSIAKTIRNSIEDYRQGRDDAALDIMEGILGYIGLLDSHMESEESTFYPITEGCLSKETQERLSEKLDIFELERLGIGRRDELEDLLDYIKILY